MLTTSKELWTLLKFNAQKQNVFSTKNPNVMLCQTQINNIQELNENLFYDITMWHLYHMCNVAVLDVLEHFIGKGIITMINFLLKNDFLKVGHSKRRIPHHSLNYSYSHAEAQDSSIQASSANLWLNLGYKHVHETISTHTHCNLTPSAGLFRVKTAYKRQVYKNHKPQF